MLFRSNSTGTMGTPASAKYARIPSQMVAPLGPAATAPTRTAAFVIALSSATPIGTRSLKPVLAMS